MAKLCSSWYHTAQKYQNRISIDRNILNSTYFGELPQTGYVSPMPSQHSSTVGSRSTRFLTNQILANNGFELHHRMGRPHNQILIPSALYSGVGQSFRQKHSLGRDWLVQLWLEEKKTKSADQRRKKRFLRHFQSGDTLFDTWSSFLLSLRRSYLRRTAPVVQGNQAEVSYDEPPISQYDGAFLSPKSAEEVMLAPLLSRANLLITRDIEWANIMLAIEQESRYVIVDPFYPQSPVGLISEKSNVIFRQLLRSRRPFIAYITDAKGNEVFRVRRPFWWINSSIYAEVNGKEIGVVHRRWHLWRRIYDLYVGNKQFAVVENPGFWNWTFTLKDDEENVLAEINRDWRGIGFELFTDAGQYVIRFGNAGSSSWSRAAHETQDLDTVRPLSLSERAVALALAVSLDSDYFSRSGGWGLPILIAGE